MQDIHGIRPPVPVGFDPMLFTIILMALGGILVLTLLFFLIKKWLKTRQQPHDLKYLPEPMAPFETALKELELLSQREILDPRLFYFDLTAILRYYIGRSFTINAIEMTSQEFIKGINSLDLDNPIKKEVAGFIKFSDPFKYAGIVPQKDQVKEDLFFIKEKIQQIEDALKKRAEQETLQRKEEEGQ